MLCAAVMRTIYMNAHIKILRLTPCIVCYYNISNNIAVKNYKSFSSLRVGNYFS